MSTPTVEPEESASRAESPRCRPLPVLVLALGNPDRGDDGAALEAAERLRAAWRCTHDGAEDEAGRDRPVDSPGDETRQDRPGVPEPEIVPAGRPGVALLDLLQGNRNVLLMDVTCSGEPAGTVRYIPLRDLNPDLLPDLRASSHGLGPGEAVALARALGRRVPPGYFLGIEGSSYGLGEDVSPTVREGLGTLVERAKTLIGEMAR